MLLGMANTLAGNRTITGSVTNIIFVEQSRGEVETSSNEYFKIGVPFTLLSPGLGSLWLV